MGCFTVSKYTIPALWLLAFIQLSSTATWRGIIDAKPGFEGQCYQAHGENQTTFFYGGTSFYDLEHCYRVDCSDIGNGKLSIDGYSCGVVGTSPPCYVTGIQIGRRYPECCPTVACPDAVSAPTPKDSKATKTTHQSKTTQTNNELFN